MRATLWEAGERVVSRRGGAGPYERMRWRSIRQVDPARVSKYIAWYVRSIPGGRTAEPGHPFEAFAHSRRDSRCHRPRSRGTIRSVAANFAAYLRVYEPLTAFDRDRQLYWRRYVKEGRAVAPLDGPGRQRTAVLEALGAGWTRLPDLPEDAYILETDDTLLVCPWNLKFRVAEAALSARDGVPPVLADAFVPAKLAGLAKTVVDDWHSGSQVLERGMPRVHEQIATWGIPLRWFVFVDLSERELDFEAPVKTLRYRTEIPKA